MPPYLTKISLPLVLMLYACSVPMDSYPADNKREKWRNPLVSDQHKNTITGGDTPRW